MSIINDRLAAALFGGGYYCRECNGRMQFEDDSQDYLVCTECGYIIPYERYGIEEDDEYEAAYPTYEDLDDEALITGACALCMGSFFLYFPPRKIQGLSWKTIYERRNCMNEDNWRKDEWSPKYKVQMLYAIDNILCTLAVVGLLMFLVIYNG